MKLSNVRLIPGMALAVLALAAPAAKAIPLVDWSNHVVGTYTPASGYNNDAAVTIGANKLITWYNGGANPNPDPNAVFSLTVGSGVPPPALPGAVFGFKDEDAPFGAVNSATSNYVLGKYGNTAYLFFIGNIDAGNITLPATFGGQNSLSHFVAFSRASVPDGGTTIALLGVCMLIMEGVRRKLRRR